MVPFNQKPQLRQLYVRKYVIIIVYTIKRLVKNMLEYFVDIILKLFDCFLNLISVK